MPGRSFFPYIYTQIHSLTTKQLKMLTSSTCHSSMPSPLSACKHPNAMNSALTLVSFQPPSFNLKHGLQSRHQLISTKWRKRHQCSAKPIRAILRPNATRGLNNAYHGGNNLPSSPLTDVIQEFYSSLNDKDITRLEKLISPDCVIEDTAYYKLLDAKNTHTYFTRLIKVMGKNAKFAIDEVCQGVEPTVAVMWHLEWHGEIIPFAKGCSFFICSENEAALLIRKVHIFDESPLKPGKLALEILNFVTNVFDTFPYIAKGFLKNKKAIAQFFVRFYKFCGPFIVPLLAYYTDVPILAYYTRFWSYVAQGLTMVLNMLYNIFKRFL
uniref:SnoaL-like domain-containing protein n=1 Tax=Hordeum vulgare subsp. vulgare TaxID=112509 RepID=A0A287T1X0_HORVV